MVRGNLRFSLDFTYHGCPWNLIDLGPFDLKPDWLEGNQSGSLGSLEAIHTCLDYGRVLAEMLG